MLKLRNIVVAVCGISAIIAFSLIGCSHEQPGTDIAYQKGTNNCSDQFVSNYNKVTSQLGLVGITDDGLNTFEGLVNDFASQYKDVVCKANLTSQNKLNDTPSTINANAEVKRWKELVAQFQQLIVPPPPVPDKIPDKTDDKSKPTVEDKKESSQDIEAPSMPSHEDKNPTTESKPNANE